MKIEFELNNEFYVRNPQETMLGQRIVEYGVHCMYEFGFEGFTFKKLAQRINSTEASIYRYFENKHKLFLYYTAIYWEWLSYRVQLQCTNTEDAKQRLDIFLQVICTPGEQNHHVKNINEELLYKILVTEGFKVYHHKDVDTENSLGLFKNLKSFVQLLADLLQELNPDYPYLKTLSTTVIETAFNQVFYSEHMPNLSDLDRDKEPEQLFVFLKSLIVKQLELS